MLTNVQVLAGATSVARFADVIVWFETGPQGGGVTLTQLLQAVEGVSTGSVPSRQMGARLAAVLNTGDASAVPALVAATPEAGGLRVVVHGWGAVVADGVHVPNGWVDQVIADRRTFFLGRNTVTPMAPVEGSTLDLEDGLVPGDGVSFALAAPQPAPPGRSTPPAAVPAAAPAAPPSPRPAPEAAPVAAAPPPAVGTPAAEPPAYEPPPSDPPPAPSAISSAGRPGDPGRPGEPVPTTWPPVGAPPGPAAAPPSTAPAGRLVLDDGSSAVLERTCVLGSAPHDSPAVQTGVAVPLTVLGPGVAPIHAEIRLEQGQPAVRDLGRAPTFLLWPGTASWAPLAAGQISTLTPGTRIALGQRTITYERP